MREQKGDGPDRSPGLALWEALCGPRQQQWKQRNGCSNSTDVPEQQVSPSGALGRVEREVSVLPERASGPQGALGLRCGVRSPRRSVAMWGPNYLHGTKWEQNGQTGRKSDFSLGLAVKEEA